MAHAGLVDLDGLNRSFAAWVEGVYHRRPHGETGVTPLERFEACGPPALPTPEQLGEAFRWAEHRRVTKTATISLFGNTYEVDPALVGQRIEVVFDPFDLTELEVRYQNRPMGTARPHRIGRHTHPQARPETAPPPLPTGIDYLALVETRRHEHLAKAGGITYATLPAPDETQLTLPGTDPEEAVTQ